MNIFWKTRVFWWPVSLHIKPDRVLTLCLGCRFVFFFADLKITYRQGFQIYGERAGGQVFGKTFSFNGPFVVFRSKIIPNVSKEQNTCGTLSHFQYKRIKLTNSRFWLRVLFWKWTIFGPRCPNIIFMMLEGLSVQLGVLFLWQKFFSRF